MASRAVEELLRTAHNNVGMIRAWQERYPAWADSPIVGTALIQAQTFETWMNILASWGDALEGGGRFAGLPGFFPAPGGRKTPQAELYPGNPSVVGRYLEGHISPN
jgi:hypothetical protein